jgi:hypothetical protein
MGYAIIYAPDAAKSLQERLRELDGPEILGCVEEAMERLAANPAAHSKVSPVPLPKGQAYDFYCSLSGGRRIHFRVHFLYRANEQELWVFDVKATPYIAM